MESNFETELQEILNELTVARTKAGAQISDLVNRYPDESPQTLAFLSNAAEYMLRPAPEIVPGS